MTSTSSPARSYRKAQRIMSSDNTEPNLGTDQPPEFPSVVNIETKRRTITHPERRFVPRRGPAKIEVIEFTVEFAEPVPPRALAPVLWLGDTENPVRVPSARNVTRKIIAFNLPIDEKFETSSIAGLRISVGWSGEPASHATTIPDYRVKL